LEVCTDALLAEVQAFEKAVKKQGSKAAEESEESASEEDERPAKRKVCHNLPMNCHITLITHLFRRMQGKALWLFWPIRVTQSNL
jgi:hypothetical protein